MAGFRTVSLLLIWLAASVLHTPATAQQDAPALAFEELARLPVGTPLLVEMRDGSSRGFFLVRMEGARARLEEGNATVSLVSSQINSLRLHPHRTRLDYLDLLIRRGRAAEARRILLDVRPEHIRQERQHGRWQALHDRLLVLEQKPFLAEAERLLAEGELPQAFAVLGSVANSRPEFGLVRAMQADLASDVLEEERELALLGRFLLDFPEPPGGAGMDERRDRMEVLLAGLIASRGEDRDGGPDAALATGLLPLIRLWTVLAGEQAGGDGRRHRYLEEYFPDGNMVRWDWPEGPILLDLDAAVFHEATGNHILPPVLQHEVVRELASPGRYGVAEAWELEGEPRQRALQFLGDRAGVQLIIASVAGEYQEAKAQALAILEVFEAPRVRSLSVGNLPMVVGERPRAPRAGGTGRGAPPPEASAAEVVGLLDSLGSHHAALMLVPMLLSEDVTALSHRREAREIAGVKLHEMTEQWIGFLERPGVERDIEERMGLLRAWLPEELSPGHRDELGRVEERLARNKSARTDLEQLRRAVEAVHDVRTLPVLGERADELAGRHQTTPYASEFTSVGNAIRVRHQQVEQDRLAEQRRRQEEAAREREARAEANRRALEQAARRTAEQYMEALSSTANRYQRLRRLWDGSTGEEPMTVERLHSFTMRRVTLSEDQMSATVAVYMDFENEAGVRFNGEYLVRLRRPHLTASDWKVYSLEE